MAAILRKLATAFLYMTGIPDDLVPLPTQPWDERPLELPLDREEVRTAIWRCEGNVRTAAIMLKVDSGRLRRFIKASEYLSREIQEAKEQLVDIAEGVVRDALDDPDRADQMARFVLQTQGKHRGWGNGSGGVKIEATAGTVVFQWASGEPISAPKSDKLIEGEFTDVS